MFSFCIYAEASRYSGARDYAQRMTERKHEEKMMMCYELQNVVTQQQQTIQQFQTAYAESEKEIDFLLERNNYLAGRLDSCGCKYDSIEKQFGEYHE